MHLSLIYLKEESQLPIFFARATVMMATAVMSSIYF